MRYANRREAGRLLGAKLQDWRGRNDVVVLALPRGGVPVAFEVATHIGAPLDVLIVRKLGVPGQPELALGALASGNVVVENSEIMALVPEAEHALQRALIVEERELKRRETTYRQAAPAQDFGARTALVVDDGLATGATMSAAVQALKRRGAARVIVAVPVASREALERLQFEADEVVCLQAPLFFNAVGEWYEDFSQTQDDEVCSLLAAASAAGGR
jgi:putative phosphoribosyl transferase